MYAVSRLSDMVPILWAALDNAARSNAGGLCKQRGRRFHVCFVLLTCSPLKRLLIGLQGPSRFLGRPNQHRHLQKIPPPIRPCKRRTHLESDLHTPLTIYVGLHTGVITFITIAYPTHRPFRAVRSPGRTGETELRWMERVITVQLSKRFSLPD